MWKWTVTCPSDCWMTASAGSGLLAAGHLDCWSPCWMWTPLSPGAAATRCPHQRPSPQAPGPRSWGCCSSSPTDPPADSHSVDSAAGNGRSSIPAGTCFSGDCCADPLEGSSVINADGGVLGQEPGNWINDPGPLQLQGVKRLKVSAP